MLTESELDTLESGCRKVPITSSVYVNTDPVETLLETVIDYQMQTTAVRRAIEHFLEQRATEIRTIEDLKACLRRYPDTSEGNVDLALYLWGYRLWTRARQLRGLVGYFDELGVSTFEGLQEWARSSTFGDFQGRVKGRAGCLQVARHATWDRNHQARCACAQIRRSSCGPAGH